MSHAADHERRWKALRERTPEASAPFYYAVRTTGIFCRQGCSSRLPKRENVEFFDTWQAALAAGYRPCRRCTPTKDAREERLRRVIEQACRRIEHAESMPNLGELARWSGLSSAHFHRVFKARLGITPAQYARGTQAKRLRERLDVSASVTEAIHASGFEASSRAYESARRHLGMTPTRYRRGASGVTIRYALARCALGWVSVAATERGICSVELGDEPFSLRDRLHASFPKARLEEATDALAAALAAIARAIETPAHGVNLPLDIQGTAFQQRVWRALQAIPAGTTVTYAELAARVGAPRAVRAVAAACGANKLALAIPCHRVVGSDGALTGYRWGIERKRALLASEGGEIVRKKARKS
jgi:AraC family transcriptional regulator, regulatory protein of adaptative response / methylated-DNA-[protein]-cysteine methyltransferase